MLTCFVQRHETVSLPCCYLILADQVLLSLIMFLHTHRTELAKIIARLISQELNLMQTLVSQQEA